VDGLMNLPVMEERWTVLVPLVLAISFLPASHNSGFSRCGQPATSRTARRAPRPSPRRAPGSAARRPPKVLVIFQGRRPRCRSGAPRRRAPADPRERPLGPGPPKALVILQGGRPCWSSRTATATSSRRVPESAPLHARASARSSGASTNQSG
jgi:hypothetical protein